MITNDIFYETIEKSAQDNRPIFCNGMQILMLSDGNFRVENYFWMDENRNIYRAILKPKLQKSTSVIGMYVIGSQTLDGFSSGNTKMFTKNNRYSSVI